MEDERESSRSECGSCYRNANNYYLLLSYSSVGKGRKDEGVPPARPLELFTNSKGRTFVKFTLDGLDWYSYPLQKKVSSKRVELWELSCGDLLVLLCIYVWFLLTLWFIL